MAPASFPQALSHATPRPTRPSQPRSASIGPMALWLAGLLSACGGGGSSDIPAPLAMPTGLRVEAASAGSDLTAASLTTQGAALAQAVMFTTGNPLASAAFSLQAAPVAMLATAGSDLLRQALARRASLEAQTTPLGMETLTEACLVSGSLRLSADDADDNGALSPGDSIALQATACVTAPDAPTLSGLFALTVERVELDGSGQVQALQASGTMAGFGVGAAGTMDGGFRLWMRNGATSPQLMRIRYEDMLVRRAGQGTLIFDFDVLTLVSSGEVQHTLSGGLVLDGLTYRLEPVDGAPLTLAVGGGLPGSFYEPPSDLWPRSGALRLRDAAGDALVLRARPGAAVDLEFTPAGAAAPTASLPGQPWSRYLQPPG